MEPVDLSDDTHTPDGSCSPTSPALLHEDARTPAGSPPAVQPDLDTSPEGDVALPSSVAKLSQIIDEYVKQRDEELNASQEEREAVPGQEQKAKMFKAAIDSTYCRSIGLWNQ